MITVGELLGARCGDVQAIGGDRTVLEAALRMNKHRIGALVVVDEGEMTGILTERDILTRVVAEARDPAHTDVVDVMTDRVLTCQPATRLAEARKVMRESRVRHLPVVEESRLVGMISIGDLNAVENETLVETIHHMESYIAGG